MTRIRSRSHPVTTLRSALRLLRQVVEQLGTGTYDRDTLAKALGYSSASGPAARKIASLVHFGLLFRQKGLYGPSPLGSRLLASDPADQKSDQRELRQAFFAPVLFREIVERYLEEGGRIPLLLPEILVRNHGISEAARQDTATVFLESGQFSGVLDEQGKILYSEPDRALPSDSAEPPTVPLGPSSGSLQQVSTASEPSVDPKPLCFPLTAGKVAEFHLPANLTADDVRLLEKQVDFLKTQVEFDTPNVVPFRRPGTRNT